METIYIMETYYRDPILYLYIIDNIVSVLGHHNIVQIILGLHIGFPIGLYTYLYIHYGDYILYIYIYIYMET